MKRHAVLLPPDLAKKVRHLPPALKKKIREALEEIGLQPQSGKSLKNLLEGLRSYRVSDYRIVYEVISSKAQVNIVDIEIRKTVYQKLEKAAKDKTSV